MQIREPLPVCVKIEIQIGLAGVKKTQARRHGNVPKICTTFVELTTRTKIHFSDRNLNLEQPLDQESKPKRQFIEDSGASLHIMSKVDTTL